MDVRCERCKTEYEFDDARITEAGVTVKCTTCGHVFKVKKKALVVTVPVKPGEADGPALTGTRTDPAAPPVASAGAGSAATPPREWKVRQANGNVFTFKELTTLQKWIVERKVSRDDEISLTGETWKRLGNIAELASFFQVVEEAQKAAELKALQTQGLLNPMMTPPGGNPLPPVPANGMTPGTAVIPQGAMPVIGAPAAGGYGHLGHTPPAPQPVIPAPAAAAPVAPAPVPAAPVAAAPAVSSAPSTPAVASAPPAAPAPSVRAPSQPVGGEPRFVAQAQQVRSAARAQAPDVDDTDDLAAAGLKKSGGAGKWLVVLLLLAGLGGGGYYGYFHYWLPQQQAQQQPSQVAQPGKQGSTGAPNPTPNGNGAASGAGTQLAAVSGAGSAAIANAEDAGAVGAAAVASADAGAATDTSVVAAADAGAGDAGTASIAAAAADAGLDAGAAAATAEAPKDAADAKGSEVKPANATGSPAPARSFDYWMAQGDRLREREKYEGALDAYGKAGDMQPNRAEPHAGRGLALLDLGHRVQAEAAFREALKINPRYAVAVMGLAETYKAMGKKQEAIQYYEKYLDILPNGPEAPVAKSAIQRLKE